jgi:hypothetical protein
MYKENSMSLASLAHDGTKISFNGALATTILLGHDEIAIKFDSLVMSTMILRMSEALAMVGKEIQFVKAGKPVDQYPMPLTALQKAKLDRMQVYLDELARLVGTKGKGVGGVEHRQRASEIGALKLHDISPPSIATLGRWKRAANKHSMGLAGYLIKESQDKPENKYKKEGVYDFALMCIDDHYLIKSLPSVQMAFDMFTDLAKIEFGADFNLPCYETFNNWIDEICPFKKSTLRNGKRATKALRRKAQIKRIKFRALELVEVDGLKLNIPLHDEEGNYLGTPLFIFVLDCCTRCLLGFKLVIGGGESSSAIIDAYRHAMLPKPRGTFNPNCKNNWPMCGVFEGINNDGGPGFLAAVTTAFLMLAGLRQDISESYAGWKKAYVERFNKTVRDQFAKNFHAYMGKMFDNQISDHNISELSCVTPAQLKALFELWVVDEYHQAPHSGIGQKSPQQKWDEEMKGMSPMLPVNHELLQLPAGETTFRKITGDACQCGVTINNVTYNDDEGKLKMLGLKLKGLHQMPVVSCQYSETDISKIIITNEALKIQLIANAITDGIEPGMSLVEYNAFRVKRYKNKGYGHSRTLGLSDEMNEINTATAKKMKKKQSRKQANIRPGDIANNVNAERAKQTKDLQENNQENKPDNTTKTALSDLNLKDIRAHEKF